MNGMKRWIGAFALVAVGSAASAFAAEETKAAAQAPPMSPEEQAAMAAMEKAGTPGEQHKWLASLAGTWDFSATFWMKPGAEPMVSKGTAERTTMLGGRVVAEHVTSEMMGQPFEGHGMLGFDNVSQKYWGTWNDNMSTGLYSSVGSCNAGKCEFSMTGSDPVSGKTVVTRMTSDHQGDREVHAMYDHAPDGKEWKSMELVYTRKK